MAERRSPGVVRDAIVSALKRESAPMSVRDIHAEVERTLGESVSPSTVRSYLNLNTPGKFLRTQRGTYRLVRR